MAQCRDEVVALRTGHRPVQESGLGGLPDARSRLRIAPEPRLSWTDGAHVSGAPYASLRPERGMSRPVPLTRPREFGAWCLRCPPCVHGRTATSVATVCPTGSARGKVDTVASIVENVSTSGRVPTSQSKRTARRRGDERRGVGDVRQKGDGRNCSVTKGSWAEAARSDW